MKKYLLSLSIVITFALQAQNVGVGTNNPNPSAKLDIDATNAGVLIPRVAITSATDAVTIANPAKSLLIWNTGASFGTAGFYFNSGTTVSPNWIRLLDTASSINDADSDPNNENQTVSAGSGISVSQTGQNFAITNTAPDQTVALTGTGGTSISGTYPNFTINSTDNVNDADNVVGNEYNTNVTLTGSTLNVIDGGGTKSQDLSSLKDHDWYEVGQTRGADNIADNIFTNGNVGIGASPSTELDVNGEVRIRGGAPENGKVLTAIDTDGNAVWEKTNKGEFNSAAVTAGQWYRIASNGGNRGNAEFTLRDYISGGGHSTMKFIAGVSYNQIANASFTMLNHSVYGNYTFTKVRILYKSTYDPQYVEVYINRTGNVDYSINDNLQSAGWDPVDWAVGSIPASYNVAEYDVNNSFTIGDSDDRFTVEKGGDVGISTSNPTRELDVNGEIRIRGGAPAQGKVLMAQDANGNATWGYALPKGSIIAWHKNGGGGTLPAEWRECNASAGTVNGVAIPNLNGGTTSSSGDASSGRFLRGSTTSGVFQADASNNFAQVDQNADDGGANNVTIDDDGNYTGWFQQYYSNDRMRFRNEGVETRVTNMSVVWIIKVY